MPSPKTRGVSVCNVCFSLLEIKPYVPDQNTIVGADRCSQLESIQRGYVDRLNADSEFAELMSIGDKCYLC